MPFLKYVLDMSASATEVLSMFIFATTDAHLSTIWFFHIRPARFPPGARQELDPDQQMVFFASLFFYSFIQFVSLS